MFSCLILLPLTFIGAAIGFLLITTYQVADYVEYVSSLGLHPEKSRLLLQIAVHFLSYAAMCSVLAATARTVSPPLSPDRPVIVKYAQLVLEAAFVAVPSVVLIVLSIQALTLNTLDGSKWILWLGAFMAGVGLVATVLAIWIGCPLAFFRSSLRPFAITKVDLLGFIVLAAGAAFFVSFLRWPVESADFFGIFPVLFLTVATACLIVAAIFAPGSPSIAILSIVVGAVVVLQVVDSPPLTVREFRHTSVLTKSDDNLTRGKGLEGRSEILPLEPAFRDGEPGLEGRSEILPLEPAFRRWLAHRRPVIEAYRMKKKTYPVFVVAAQGGGINAAYHAALSLARLYDACPELAHHLFAISAVSGGSLGSAVFAELLSSVPPSPPSEPDKTSVGCNPKDGADKLEEKVTEFFSANFLSPVIASALIFDLPGLLVPQLRFFGLDRAVALEYAFEGAWRKKVKGNGKAGLAENFYGRWQPEGLPPALFLGATDVNHGIPVLVSQIYWSPATVYTFYELEGYSHELNDKLHEVLLRDRGLSLVAQNILDFRPDLQLVTSTAVALSARFPYLTPPANIRANRRIKSRRDLYKGMEVLELLDGGFLDNSGGVVAQQLIEDLEMMLRIDPHLKKFKSDVTFHLIQFTDKDVRRDAKASKSGHSEVVAPLLALNNIRLARPPELRKGGTPSKPDPHFIYLADNWFESSLNWLLRPSSKGEIEARSGVKRKEVCCRIHDEWDAKLTEREEQELAPFKVERFVPNERTFHKLIELVK
jgi:hypothetical protein